MSKEFKYIQNADNGVGEIRIYKPIGNVYDQEGYLVEHGINGADFANEMQYLASTCKKINIRINSEGGSVLDGYAIMSSILNCKVPTATYVDGLAVSTAGWCAMAGKKRYIADYGTLMIHEASGGNKEVLEVINQTIATMISNNCKMAIEDVRAMMAKETWITASNSDGRKQLLNDGFFDSVISTGKYVDVDVENVNKSELVKIYNKLLTKEKPNMEKILNHLKLRNTADENAAIDAIKETEQKVADLTAEKDALVKEKEALEAKLKEFEDAKAAEVVAETKAIETEATDVVNQAVTAKKITEAEKAEYIASAKVSRAALTTVKNLLAKISTVKTATKIFNAEEIDKDELDRSTWTFEDWKTKDQKGLQEMMATNYAQFEALAKAQPVKKV